MIFDCRVYDKKGTLVKTHTAEELEEKSRLILLSQFTAEDKKVIENFDCTPLEEYEIKIGYAEPETE